MSTKRIRRKGIPTKIQDPESKEAKEAKARQKEKLWFDNVLKEHEILQRTLKDIITNKSNVEEDIVTVWRVPLLQDGTTLEEIPVGAAGWILFEIGGEQCKCKCQNVDDEALGQYVTVFTIDVPNDQEAFQQILRGSSMQWTINNYIAQEITQRLQTVTITGEVLISRFPPGTWDSISANHTYVGAGAYNIITITPANETTVYIGDLTVGGDTLGYGYITWDGVQEWSRLYFPVNCSVVEQFVGRIKNGFVGDGTKTLDIILYLGAAGIGSASLTYKTC